MLTFQAEHVLLPTIDLKTMLMISCRKVDTAFSLCKVTANFHLSFGTAVGQEIGMITGTFRILWSPSGNSVKKSRLIIVS